MFPLPFAYPFFDWAVGVISDHKMRFWPALLQAKANAIADESIMHKSVHKSIE
jgi:hypothetical protein